MYISVPSPVWKVTIQRASGNRVTVIVFTTSVMELPNTPFQRSRILGDNVQYA